MNLEQAKAKVAETNPNACWVATSFFKGQPDTFDTLDNTYSDEVKARIFQYDCCTEALYSDDVYGMSEVTA